MKKKKRQKKKKKEKKKGNFTLGAFPNNGVPGSSKSGSFVLAKDFVLDSSLNTRTSSIKFLFYPRGEGEEEALSKPIFSSSSSS